MKRQEKKQVAAGVVKSGVCYISQNGSPLQAMGYMRGYFGRTYDFDRKRAFVEMYLRPMAMRIVDKRFNGLLDIEYYVELCSGRVRGEFVRMKYACGKEVTLNVTRCSMADIAVSVLQAIA